MSNKDLVYIIPPEKHSKEDLLALLKKYSEIKFVSLVGIDFAGNDTDEKIPVSAFIDDMDTFLNGTVVQTDGSSVVLPGIASLNNARVDFKVDLDVNWSVDYNYEHIDPETGKMVGTIRIPSFLVHDGILVDSRSILKNSLEYVRQELLQLLKENNKIDGLAHINGTEVEDIVFTCATELEFWVKTPAEDAPLEQLTASQVLKEQYWQRMRGNVRTAMEQCIIMLERYGLEPEMGHKEVGGVKAQINETGHLSHVMEQLEIDWKFSFGLQTADNELIARIIIKEVFRQNGLDVTFQAKPIIGVAGSGEHVHVGIVAKLKNGKEVNLFTPTDMKKDFVSVMGYGAIMGLLKNYEVINPFITATNDSFNRLKPGFEAPVCIVTCLGHSPENPSRNRTVLVGLIRDLANPRATRFEVRSPNPFTNTYIAIAVVYLAMLDGIKASIQSGKTMQELEQDLSKKAGEQSFYLETERQYRSEEDVFDDFTAEERDRIFGKPPATVWENLQAFDKYPQKLSALTVGNTMRPEFVKSFALGALKRWREEILNRIIPDYYDLVISMKRLHDNNTATDSDLALWGQIQAVRIQLAKDSFAHPSMFTQLKKSFEEKKYEEASRLQLEIADKVENLKNLYVNYKRNIID